MSPLASYLVETLVMLTGVVALAVLVLYGARRAGLGKPTGPLALVGRLPIDARRAVYLVRAGKQVLIVGASEAGLTRLGEIDPAELPAGEGAPTFSSVLARARGRAAGGGDAA